MEKVIELFYTGETHVTNAIKNKVMDALRFLKVDNLLEPTRPILKTSQPPIAMVQPKPMPPIISKEDAQTNGMSGFSIFVEFSTLHWIVFPKLNNFIKLFFDIKCVQLKLLPRESKKSPN